MKLEAGGGAIIAFGNGIGGGTNRLPNMVKKVHGGPRYAHPCQLKGIACGSWTRCAELGRHRGAGVERPAGTEPERRGEGCLTGPDLGRHRCTLNLVAEVMADFSLFLFSAAGRMLPSRGCCYYYRDPLSINEKHYVLFTRLELLVMLICFSRRPQASKSKGLLPQHLVKVFPGHQFLGDRTGGATVFALHKKKSLGTTLSKVS